MKYNITSIEGKHIVILQCASPELGIYNRWMLAESNIYFLRTTGLVISNSYWLSCVIGTTPNHIQRFRHELLNGKGRDTISQFCDVLGLNESFFYDSTQPLLLNPNFEASKLSDIKINEHGTTN